MGKIKGDVKGDVLACERVSLAYTDGDRTTYALRDVSVTLAPGNFYGIMGPSGSGKSSLLYILSALKRPTEGAARLGDTVYATQGGAALTRLRRDNFGFVFQQPFLLPFLSALENALTASPKGIRDPKAKAMELFDSLGMAELAHKLPSQLSGGERQRVSIVRAMMNDPQIIFADEPTAALDNTNGHRVIDTLAAWRARGMVVVVTHDPEMVADADSVILLRDGKLVSQSNVPAPALVGMQVVE